MGADWERIGSGLGADWERIGKLGADWERIGSGLIAAHTFDFMDAFDDIVLVSSTSSSDLSNIGETAADTDLNTSLKSKRTGRTSRSSSSNAQRYGRRGSCTACTAAYRDRLAVSASVEAKLTSYSRAVYLSTRNSDLQNENY